MGGFAQETWQEGDLFDDDTGFINDFNPDTTGGIAPTESNVDMYPEDPNMAVFVRIQAGSGHTFNYWAKNTDGSPMDLTGAKSEWTLSVLEGATPIVTKFEGGGIIFPTAGLAQVYIAPEETLPLAGRYRMEMAIELGGQTVRRFVGDVQIAPSSVGIVQ